MFFVWVNDGRPLHPFQLVSLATIFLQVVLQLFPELHVSVSHLILPAAVLFALFFVVWHQRGQDNAARISRWFHQTRDQLQELTGMEWTMTRCMGLAGLVVGILTAMCVSTHANAVVPYVHQMIMMCALYYMVMGREDRAEDGTEAKMAAMADLMCRMPLESFVTEKSQCSQELSIAQLKRMLEIRGVTQEEMDSFVDRINLVECLKEKRRYTDTCCICFETYQEGEPLRILPTCHHELHLECLDKWVYTFATPAKLGQEPTCPLCKEPLS